MAPRKRRVVVLAAVFVGCFAVTVGLAVSGGESVDAGGEDEDRYPGETLITVQAYDSFTGDNGEAFIVDEDGERTWSYRPDNASVFDGEVLENGNVMVSYGQRVPNAECPAEYRDAGSQGERDHCIRNVVEEVDRESGERVWAHTWYDHFVTNHEVHDADRLDDGETIIADMGRNRVFAVNRSGSVTWNWSAVEHLDEGTRFWENHVEGTSREDHDYRDGSQDWTHLNDVDRLENGNVLVSIRNFDVLLEIDRDTGDVARVIGEPGNHSLMYEQHDPNYLERHDHVIVSDSENNRIVEYDLDSMEAVWQYDGTGPQSQDRLQWPRDADRLPNGNTLIVDSRNFRVIEVNETGAVVWQHDLADEVGIVYDADRLGSDERLGEEPEDVPAGDDLDGREYDDGFTETVAFVESWLGFVFPRWAGLLGAAAILTMGGCAIGLLWEGFKAHREA